MKRDGDPINGLNEKIIGCGFRVLNTPGNGFLDKVYENALAYELRKQGLRVEQQYPVPVYDEGAMVGDFLADLIVEGQVIVELKAVDERHDILTARCLDDVKATGLPIGLLLNFGKPMLDIKRYVHPSFPT